MRQIDADALKEWAEEYHASNWGIPQDELIYAIGSAPTIEPKRGKWESNEYLYTTRQTICSECKTEFYVDDLLNVGEGAQEYLPNYCPHCGAKMEGVEDATD